MTDQTRVVSGMTDRQLLETIMKKMEVIDGIQATLNSFTERMIKTEEDVSQIQTHVDDLDRGVSYMETEMEELKDRLTKVEGKRRKLCVQKCSTGGKSRNH